jgi:tetratricopeptide (TPR) repeat protein
MIMKKVFLFAILVWVCLGAYGQEKDTTLVRLKKELEVASNAQKKVQLYFELSDHQLTRNFNESLDYLEQAEEFLKTENLKNSEKSYAELYERLGVINRRKGDYIDAISYYLKARKLYEELNDTLSIGSIVHNIGIVYRFQGENERAIQNFKQAVHLHTIVKDTFGIAAAYNMMGVSYCKLNKLDSALVCYERASELFKLTKDDENVRRVSNNFSTLYAVQRQYDKSIPIKLDNLEHYKKNDNKMSISVAYFNLSKDYSGLQDYEKALKYADSSLAISLQEGYKERISRTYRRRSSVYRYMSNYKAAYEDYVNYKKYADSVHDINDIKKIQELELKFEFEKEKEELQIRAEENEQKLLLYAIVFILVLLGGGYIGYLSYRNYTARVRIVKEKLEKEKLKKELLREKVKVSESELKSLVADNSMRLKFIQELSEQIKGDRKETDSKDIQSYTQSLLLRLQQQIATESKLSSIQDRIEEVNRGFDQKIIELYPNLTKTEREVCALLRLNLSIKEIAAIRNATPDSVKASRYRIRKKLQVPSGVELEKFIQSL